MVKIPFARFLCRIFRKNLEVFWFLVSPPCSSFRWEILIWCRGWCRWLVFPARDISFPTCQKIPFHVKLLPRRTLTNRIFKLQILTIWSITKAGFKSDLPMLLGFSDVIFVGIWAHNWIWSKTFLSSIFCDGSIASSWACHNKGFFNYSPSKAQAPNFNLGGKGLDFWFEDQIYIKATVKSELL